MTGAVILRVFAQALESYLEAKNTKKVSLNGSFAAGLLKNFNEVLL